MSLVERIKTVTPENILKLTDQELRECYFSRQKSTYSMNWSLFLLIPQRKKSLTRWRKFLLFNR